MLKPRLSCSTQRRLHARSRAWVIGIGYISSFDPKSLRSHSGRRMTWSLLRRTTLACRAAGQRGRLHPIPYTLAGQRDQRGHIDCIAYTLKYTPYTPYPIPLQGSGANGDVYRVMQAGFGPALSGLAASTAAAPLKLLAASPADGCFPYSKPGAYLGAVVLLQRGNCSFESKVPPPLT